MKEIIEYLYKEPKLYKDVKVFSTKPGIYAFFYLAKTENEMFPFEPGELIYIGKTESSQKKRDANTHFKSGKTGSSTFRKSIGSILINELNLVPIPRNSSDFKKGRISMFKFDDKSEEKLTRWLKDHIAMTFYEFEGSKGEIDTLETEIIQTLTPPLNISKNSNNPFKGDIQKLRKNAAEIAHSGNNIKTKKLKSKGKPVMKKEKIEAGLSSNKYAAYWNSKLPELKKGFKMKRFPIEIRLSKQDFEKLGNRKDYSFNIQFTGPEVANNLSGSAVARDLTNVILNDTEMRSLLNGGSYKIRMDKDFMLHVTKT